MFLERGPFILVMVAATGEPEAALMCQLRLIHGQILSILSSSVEKMFARNPSYDARKLLGMVFFIAVTVLKCLIQVVIQVVHSLRHPSVQAT